MNYEAFMNTVKSGHLEELDRIIQNLSSSQLGAMIQKQDYESFRQAAGNGHLIIIDRLIELAPTKVSDMVCSDNFHAFKVAASNGHLPVVKRLIELVQDRVSDMVCSIDFGVFRWAARYIPLFVIQPLIEPFPDGVLDMVSSDNFIAFQRAAANGHLPVVKYLIESLPTKVSDMVSSRNFYAFRHAAGEGHLPVVKYLIELAPDRVWDMVSAHRFDAFRYAAATGHLPIVKLLIELAPTKVSDMVSAYNFLAFRAAAENGHLDVIDRLIELARDRASEMVSSNYFEAFRWAARNHHLSVVQRLIVFPIVFAYAEMHVREYGSYVEPYVSYFISKLLREMTTFNAEHPDAVFDISDTEQAKLYFYIMRNLIRQNTPESLNHLNLLLSIPSVKALAHQALTPNVSNELLRLAVSLNNSEAAAMLLNIPAVRTLAEEENFYRNEQRGGLDLRALAQDRESSMRELTQGEQQRLAGAKNRYQGEINQRGAPAIIDELKELLMARYRANPAMVTTGDGRIIELPLEFNEFQALAKILSADTRERALQSYYQHYEHTALRYLSKPNQWMSKDAHFVERGREGGWSSFEGHRDLISLMYLAAKDEGMPAIDEHTIESRINNFIREISLIGRAHNYDASRINPTTGKSEEYDDLKGDKPSCYLGVKRRLFQSVHGHPLLFLLTTGIIDQEIREFMREHFKSRINGGNYKKLHDTWQGLIEDGKVDSSIMDTLNLTNEEQSQFVEYISKKYGSQFDGEMKQHLLRRLNIESDFRNLAEKFGGECDLLEILQQKKQELDLRPCSREELRARRLDFFQKKEEEPSPTEEKHSKERPK